LPLFLPNVLVLITRAGNEGTGGAQSYLLAKLSSGGSWTENINGVDITVTVESINTSTGDAILCVTQAGSACSGTAAPTPSPTPFDGVMAVYDGSIGAPRCASTGKLCSSGILLNGRAGLGAEPNAPNTLDSCTDGTSGGYHGDESNDEIVVSSVDGYSLTAGGLAVIEATAWVYSATDDFADFYYTADINPPIGGITWNFINTAIPSGEGSLQTLTSSQFTLPNNSAVQAVRVNFRWQGAQVVCPTGGYDDTDDLVFAVVVDETSPAPTPPPITPAPITSAPVTPSRKFVCCLLLFSGVNQQKF
jgi:hypothetical protein